MILSFGLTDMAEITTLRIGAFSLGWSFWPVVLVVRRVKEKR